MPVDADSFRQALASWASGVTVVTSRDGTRVHGMTVSAFSSVSLTPPLVLVCADKSSNTLALIDRSKVFSVSVLSQEQSQLSNLFASKKDEERRFDGLRCQDGATGCPLIPGALASLDCRVVQAIDAGDHVIYVGSVEAARTREATPLVYFRSRYRGLAEP
jgi:flavin reductase (DIM6/NTAB) family NADH-FMN oxidoreductase RutF